MKRDEFLKKIALGMGVAVVAPMVLKAENDPIEKNKTSLAIDVEAISHFTMGGQHISVAEVIDLWHETGILVYNSRFGNCPYLFNGKVELIDLNG